MSNDTTQHTRTNVRDRVTGAWATVEAAALAQAAVLDSHYGGQPAKATEIRNAVEQVAALLRTPRGEGDVKPLAWRVEYRGRTGGEWEYLNTYDLVEVAKEKVERMRRGGVRLEYRIVPLYPAASRSDAQAEDRWEDLVFGPIVQAYNEAHAARRDEGGGA